jgi:hypothetical protein
VRVGSKVMAAAFAAGATFLLVPAGMTDSLRQDWKRLTGDPGQACFDHERLKLADPDGARFDFHSVSASDASEVTIRYRASTGDEADVDTEAICVFRDGRVSAEDTARRREHALAARRIDALMAEFDCLQSKKAQVLAGRADEARRERCPR